MFSIDTETGFDKVVLVNAAWGLGENVVQGAVDPDEYQVFKPLLSQPLLVPIIEKKLGEKAKKMVYAQDGDRPTRNVPTSKADRATFVLSDKDILALGRWACVIESITPTRWTWSGRRMARAANCSSCRRDPRRCNRARRRARSDLTGSSRKIENLPLVSALGMPSSPGVLA